MPAQGTRCEAAPRTPGPVGTGDATASAGAGAGGRALAWALRITAMAMIGGPITRATAMGARAMLTAGGRPSATAPLTAGRRAGAPPPPPGRATPATAP